LGLVSGRTVPPIECNETALWGAVYFLNWEILG
jgi:hypothetical protein